MLLLFRIHTEFLLREYILVFCQRLILKSPTVHTTGDGSGFCAPYFSHKKSCGGNLGFGWGGGREESQ